MIDIHAYKYECFHQCLRSAIHQAKVALVLYTGRVGVVACFYVFLEVVMDHTRVIAHFQLSDARDAQEFVLIEDVAKFIIRYTAVVVPSLPVKAIHQGALGELTGEGDT